MLDKFGTFIFKNNSSTLTLENQLILNRKRPLIFRLRLLSLYKLHLNILLNNLLSNHPLSLKKEPTTLSLLTLPPVLVIICHRNFELAPDTKPFAILNHSFDTYQQV